MNSQIDMLDDNDNLDSAPEAKLPWNKPVVVVHEIASTTKGTGANTGDGLTNFS